MELNLNREFIKGAVTGILYNEQQASGYPKQSFDFHVIKEGNFWELQFIYVIEIFEVRGGDNGETLEDEKTESFKKPICEDATIEDLVSIIQESLQEIYLKEYRG
jgi:hypothetical protein